MILQKGTAMKKLVFVVALLSCSLYSYEIPKETIDIYNAARNYDAGIIGNATSIQLEHAKDYARDVAHDSLTTKILTEIRFEKDKSFFQKHYRLTTVLIPLVAMCITIVARVIYERSLIRSQKITDDNKVPQIKLPEIVRD